MVGANLLHSLYSPWETIFILRKRLLPVSEIDTEVRYTILGGHTVSSSRLVLRWKI